MKSSTFPENPRKQLILITPPPLFLQERKLKHKEIATSQKLSWPKWVSITYVNVSFEMQKGLVDLGEGSCPEDAIIGISPIPANLISGPFLGTGVAIVPGPVTTRTMMVLFQYLLNNCKCWTPTVWQPPSQKRKIENMIELQARRGRCCDHSGAGIAGESKETKKLWKGRRGRLGEATPSTERNDKKEPVSSTTEGKTHISLCVLWHSWGHWAANQAWWTQKQSWWT